MSDVGPTVAVAVGVGVVDALSENGGVTSEVAAVVEVGIVLLDGVGGSFEDDVDVIK